MTSVALADIVRDLLPKSTRSREIEAPEIGRYILNRVRELQPNALEKDILNDTAEHFGRSPSVVAALQDILRTLIDVGVVSRGAGLPHRLDIVRVSGLILESIDYKVLEYLRKEPEPVAIEFIIASLGLGPTRTGATLSRLLAVGRIRRTERSGNSYYSSV